MAKKKTAKVTKKKTTKKTASMRGTASYEDTPDAADAASAAGEGAEVVKEQAEKEVAIAGMSHAYETPMLPPERTLVNVPEIPGMKMREEMRDADNCIVQDVFVDDCYHVRVIPPNVRTILDVGAHIGVAAAQYRRYCPDAQIISVEAHPENFRLLAGNVGGDQRTIALEGAVTYEPGDLFIHGSIYDGCHNTGGSWVGGACEPSEEYPTQHLVDKWTVGMIMADHGWDYLDVLKLDCEGSEMSILRHCDLSRVGCIVGEWHNRGEFFKMIGEVFGIIDTRGQKGDNPWRMDILRAGKNGLFRLNQPAWQYGRVHD